MVRIAARQFALSERRNQMVLTMTSHAARVKAKARKAKDEDIRQVGHRTERCRQFKGRRSTALDERVQDHRDRRFQAMLLWLEGQTLANDEEGTPREINAVERPTTSQRRRAARRGEPLPSRRG